MADEMMRFNSGKVRLTMVPPSLNYYTAMVLEYGAIKYNRENWRKGCNWNDLIDSLQRHLDAFRAGEDLDPESTLPHPAHMAFNVMALIEFYDKGIGTDDRFRYPAGTSTGRVLSFRPPPPGKQDAPGGSAAVAPAQTLAAGFAFERSVGPSQEGDVLREGYSRSIKGAGDPADISLSPPGS